VVSAVFLDRDGTIVDDPGFSARARKVKLLPGAGRGDSAAEMMPATSSSSSRINRVSQRGLYTVADYEAVQQRLGELLAAQRARIDAALLLPAPPAIPRSRWRFLRLPQNQGLKLFQEAQAALDIDFFAVLVDRRPAVGRAAGASPWEATRFWSPRGMAICIRGRHGRSV